MRYPLQATHLDWPSLRHAQGRWLGLPFIVAGVVPGVVVGWSACLGALMLTCLASFIVYVPLTALALNRGNAIAQDAPVPPLTTRAYAALLLLWTATVWLAAMVVHVR